MGFRIPDDGRGLAALERLRVWSAGGPGPEGPLPSVVAILLHDPETHLELDEWIQWNFERYDAASAGDLHFFVLAASGDDPARDARRAHERREAIERWLERDSAGAERTRVALRHAWTLLMSGLFDVAVEHLPGLIVFCPRHRERDTRGRLATYVPLGSPAAASWTFDHLLHSARGLAEGFTDVDSFHRGLRGWQVQGVPEVWDLDGLLRDEVSSLSAAGQRAWSGLRLLRAHDPRLLRLGAVEAGGLSDWYAHGDDETQTVLATALMVWRLATLSSASASWDLTAVVGGLAKAFERSLATSLMHAARRHHGIDLPRWYGKVMPAARAEEGGVDLNRPVSGAVRGSISLELPWRAPSLGDAHLVYSLCQGAGHLQGWDIAPSEDGTFRKLWSEIAERRNPFVHQYIARRGDAEALRDVLGQLSELRIPERLARLRAELSPRDVTGRAPHVHGATMVREYRVTLRLPEPRRATPPARSAIEWRVEQATVPSVTVELVLRPAAYTLRLEEVSLPALSGPVPDVLARTALVVLGLRHESLLGRIGELGERVDDLRFEMQQDAERRTDARRRALHDSAVARLRAVEVELRLACETPGMLAAVQSQHPEVIAVIASQARWLQRRGLTEWVEERVRAGWPGRELPDIQCLRQRAALEKHLEKVTAESAAFPEAAVRRVLADVEARALSPDEARPRVLGLLGVPAVGEASLEPLSKRTRRLLGSISYWAQAVAALEARDGTTRPELSPLFLALAAGELAADPKPAVVAALGTPGKLEEGPEHHEARRQQTRDRAALERELEGLRRTLSRRFSEQLTRALVDGVP